MWDESLDLDSYLVFDNYIERKFNNYTERIYNNPLSKDTFRDIHGRLVPYYNKEKKSDFVTIYQSEPIGKYGIVLELQTLRK